MRMIINRKLNVLLFPLQLVGDTICSFDLIVNLINHFKLTIVASFENKEILNLFFPNELILDKNDVLRVNINYEYCIDFWSNEISLSVLRKLQINHCIGYEDSPDPSKYKTYIPYHKYFKDCTANQYFKKSAEILLNTNFQDNDYVYFYHWVGAVQKNVLLVPGSGSEHKRWNFENYLNLACNLSRDYQVGFIIGPKERELVSFIPKHYPVNMNYLWKDTLSKMLDSSLIISNDCANMHLAGVIGTPLIGIFQSTSPKIWFPYSLSWQKSIGSGKFEDDSLPEYIPSVEEVAKLAIEILENPSK